jgi:hypothetical protein
MRVGQARTKDRGWQAAREVAERLPLTVSRLSRGLPPSPATWTPLASLAPPASPPPPPRASRPPHLALQQLVVDAQHELPLAAVLVHEAWGVGAGRESARGRRGVLAACVVSS